MFGYKSIDKLKQNCLDWPISYYSKDPKLRFAFEPVGSKEKVCWKRIDLIGAICVVSTMSKEVLLISNWYLKDIDDDVRNVIAFSLQNAGIYVSFPTTWPSLLDKIINHLKTNKKYVHLNNQS